MHELALGEYLEWLCPYVSDPWLLGSCHFTCCVVVVCGAGVCLQWCRDGQGWYRKQAMQQVTPLHGNDVAQGKGKTPCSWGQELLQERIEAEGSDICS